MKKKLILMCAAGVLAATAVIGKTLAGFHASTESKGVTNITVKALGIEMPESGNTEADTQEITIGKGAPGGEVELQHCVCNNVEGGYTLYTRVIIDKKWQDEELDASKIHLYAGTGDNRTELQAGITVNDWIVWYADAKQVILYYTRPLAAGETSSNLLDSVSFDAQMDNDYAGKQAILSFHADAVQQIAALDAIPSEWGVYPTIADGIITSIAE